MSKQPTPRADALRAMREANFERAQAANKEAAPAKPVKKKAAQRQNRLPGKPASA